MVDVGVWEYDETLLSVSEVDRLDRGSKVAPKVEYEMVAQCHLSGDEKMKMLMIQAPLFW
jgi:hypothetical protein